MNKWQMLTRLIELGYIRVDVETGQIWTRHRSGRYVLDAFNLVVPTLSLPDKLWSKYVFHLEFEKQAGTYRVDQTIWFVAHNEVVRSIQHINNDQSDNRLENLVPLTNPEMGWRRGENHPRVKLTEKAVLEIRRLYKPRDPEFNTITLAERYNVDQKTISLVVQGKTWTHVGFGRECAKCGKHFEAENFRTLYCSLECRKSARNERYYGRHREQVISKAIDRKNRG